MTLSRTQFLSPRVRWRLVMFGCLALLFAATATSGRPEVPSVFAITNARIVPVAGSVIEKGTIVLRNGIIESVGANVTTPADARIIDATGLIAYPGLIDSFSDIGLEEAASSRGGQPPQATPGRGVQQQQQTPEIPTDESRGLTPYRQASELINPSNRKIESARAAGITTALVAPRRGFFPGQSTLVNLAGEEIGAMVVKTPVSFYINTGGRGGGGGSRSYPGSLMGILSFVKQTLLDASHYETAWSIYNRNPGALRPAYSRPLEALQPVLKRQMAVVMTANSPVEIQRALDLADAHQFNLMLAGCAEAGKIVEILRDRKIPILVAVKFPERPAATEPDAREELESLRRRIEAPGNAAALAKAGVRFAFVSDDMTNPADFIRNVGRSIGAGLDRDIALRALTLTPAEFLGVADRLGSIEKNKTANIILTTGEIFDDRTRVKTVFVDGQKFDIPEPAQPTAGGSGRGRSGGGAAEASVASGKWSLTLDTSQGTTEATLTLRQNGASLSGFIESPMGAVDISQGSVTGNSFSFSITLESTNGSLVIMFQGTIAGSRMSGSINAGQAGSTAFSGTKLPGKPDIERRP